MSTRLLMNIALGTVTLLLLGSVGIVVTSLGDRDLEKNQVDVALRQQMLIQDLNQGVADLSAADNLLGVNQARSRLGDTIVHIDQNLAALVKGGEVVNASGALIHVSPVKNKNARKALEECAQTWIQTGVPLADLAAGEFSIFSAAGQEAVADLSANSPSLANQMGIAAAALQMQTTTQSTQAKYARVAVMAFGLVFGALAFARFRPASKSVSENPASEAPIGRAPAPAMNPVSQSETEPSADGPSPLSAPVQSLDWARHSGNAYTSPVDFDTVNASVDQLSVDMNTIAGSTDKMRLAIDSVGHAMQGMLFSLNEMAQDTAEGYKIVRGANNAASYTASTAKDLADSAREMSRVVARVTQLASKTQQVATQIDAEAVNTGTTGEAFTSVVAAEVQGLSRQTSSATQEIENTVAEILGTARQYEEAIGQIIKNISGINKISENLGELMLHPPAAGVAGTPLPAAQTSALGHQAVAPLPASTPAPVTAPVAEAPAPEPAPVAETPAPEPIMEDDVVAEPTVEEVAEETSAAIEESAEEIDDEVMGKSDSEPGGSSGNVFMLGGGTKKPRMDLTPQTQDAESEAPEAPEAEAEPIPAPVAEKPATEDAGGDGNIFMLNKPSKSLEKTAKPAESVSEDVPAPEPEVQENSVTAEKPAAEVGGGDRNIFMLNKPKKAAPAAETPPVEPEPAPAEPEVAVEAEDEEEDSGSNIFMLNKPKKVKKEAPAAPTTEDDMVIGGDEPAAAQEKEPVTVPAGAGDPEEDDGDSGNIFMLNKPKK